MIFKPDTEIQKCVNQWHCKNTTNSAFYSKDRTMDGYVRDITFCD